MVLRRTSVGCSAAKHSSDGASLRITPTVPKAFLQLRGGRWEALLASALCPPLP